MNNNTPTDDDTAPAAYRPSDAARRMGISRSKLYEELRAGRITAHKAGSATIITATEIEQWLAQLPTWQPDNST